MYHARQNIRFIRSKMIVSAFFLFEIFITSIALSRPNLGRHWFQLHTASLVNNMKGTEEDKKKVSGDSVPLCWYLNMTRLFKSKKLSRSASKSMTVMQGFCDT